MPNTAFFQERVLTAIEAVQAAQEGIETDVALIVTAQQTIAGASAVSWNQTYIFPLENFDTTWTQVFNTQAAKRGRVRAIDLYDVTETFQNTGSDARIDVGDGSDANAFAFSAGFGTTAAGAALAPAITQGVTEIIPIGDIVTVTGVTAGTPGNGIATVAITVEYFD